MESPKARDETSDHQLRHRILEIHGFQELEFATKPVLDVLEVILRRSVKKSPSSVHEDVADMNALDNSCPKDISGLQKTINAIVIKIYRNRLEGKDSHETTMDILNMTRHYKWDAKAVLAVAAFALSLGQFNLVEQLRSTDPLAKAVSILLKVRQIISLDPVVAGVLKPKLEALSLLIEAILDSTKSIVELYEILGNKYISFEAIDIIDFCTADIPTAVYWTIMSVVDCASQINVFTTLGPEFLSNTWELSSTAHKLKKIRSQISEQISLCHGFIEKKRDDEILDLITRVLESSHDDNSKSLGILFHEKQGQQALFDCLQQYLVPTKVLRNKVVGLFITDLDIVTEDYLILQQIYPEESRSDIQYEIVWFPIVDNWTNEKRRQFESLRDQMEWLAVNCPSEVPPQVTRYVREKCGFVKKPRVLVMDDKGKIVHKDALSMFCIWGNRGYPFSLDKERYLWRQITWSISLLAEGIDKFLPSWIEEGKYICLYGGEDIEWIRQFTKTAKQAARESGVDLELLYVGKARGRERVVRKIANVVQREKLSHALCWKLISYFWLRLEKICVTEPPLEKDYEPEPIPGPDGLEAVVSAHTHSPVLGGAVRMLSFGSSSKGWAAISEPAGPTRSVLFEGDGEVMMRAMVERGGRGESYGFATGIARRYHELCNDHRHCVSMILSDTEIRGIFCAMCNARMDKMVMYSCCTDRSSFGYYD